MLAWATMRIKDNNSWNDGGDGMCESYKEINKRRDKNDSNENDNNNNHNSKTEIMKKINLWQCELRGMKEIRKHGQTNRQTERDIQANRQILRNREANT